MTPVTIRPATTRGPVTGANLRVAYDGEVVVVVSDRATTYLAQTGPPVLTTPVKQTIPTDQGDLTVVKQTGCSCGKPWLNRPGTVALLASAEADAVRASVPA